MPAQENFSRVAIVGAGLSGLYAAHLLRQAGIGGCVVFEAREVLGGRILSEPAPQSSSDIGTRHSQTRDRFDLGPTWFWPAYQPELELVVSSLGLQRFEQFEQGDVVVERSHREPALRTRGYLSSPTSMRLQGGMAALIDVLQGRVDAQGIKTGQAVRRARRTDTGIELDMQAPCGETSTWHTEHLLLALPPRLAAESIDFTPPLPPALLQQWRSTPTWMAPHAKYVALYDAPFWREQGLSGAARSAVGPLGEIHDASMPGGSAALFGFFGVPARVRQGVAEDVLRSHCRAQLARLFGPQAGAPKAEFFKDWASDPCTATAADLDATGQHAEAPAAPATTAASGAWQGRITGIASEWSPQFPGYLAGAIEAARLGTAALVAAAAAARGR